MSDDDGDGTISDISDDDIELSEEDMKALGLDEEPEAEDLGAAVDEEPEAPAAPPPSSKGKSKVPKIVAPEPEPEEEAPLSARREKPPKPRSASASNKKPEPPPSPKPAIARRKTKVFSGSDPVTWDEVADDENDLANEEFEQPILIGVDPFEQEYNDSDYYEKLEDPLNSKAATKLLLEAIRTSQGKSKKAKAKKKTKKQKAKFGVLDYSTTKFNPKAYLSTVHKKTSIDALIAGRVQLEKRVTSRQRQLEFLVKDNFSRFVQCKDAIDDVYVRVETERRAEGPSNPIDATQESYSDLITKSKGLFDRLLDRQGEIDKIRNVLSILKRSQFIFNLPRRMRESIERGEYSKVVLNYKKVKSIVASAVHASIKNIVLEVEKIVKELHEQLFQLLDKPGVSLREQEETIKLLIELGAPVDPAWHCIVKRYERIKDMLSTRRFNAGSSSSTQQNASQSNSATNGPRDAIASKPSARSLAMTSASNVSGRSQAQAVLSYSQVLVEQLPELWQMSRSFFSGEYHKGVSEKRKKELTDQYTEEEFSKLFKELMQLYVDAVTKQFTGDFIDMKNRMHHYDKIKFQAPGSPGSPGAGGSTSSPRSPTSPDSPGGSKRRRPSRSASISVRSKRSGSVSAADQQAQQQAAQAAATVSYMFSALDDEDDDRDKEKVVAVLKCWKTVSSLGVPPSYYGSISDLLDHLTHTFTKQTMELVLEDMRTMYSLEDWLVEDVQYGITSLPLTFEATLRALLSELEGVPQPEDPLIVYIQKSFAECIEIFADNLHHLALVSLQGVVGALPSISNMNVDYSPYYDDGRNVIGADARLLLTINNCRFTRTQIIPDLLMRYQREFGRPLYKFNMASVYLFEEIERMCAQKYVANKVVVFKSLIKSGVLFSGFDWSTQSPPLGIRDFVMTILMNLIFVHDEVYRLSKSLVDSILTTLVEQIMLAFVGCFDFVDSISNYAAMQVGMEITFFWQVVSARYKNDLSSALYKEIDSIIGYNSIMASPDTNQKDKNNIKAILKNRQAHSELLFECFSAQNGSSSATTAVEAQPKTPRDDE